MDRKAVDALLLGCVLVLGGCEVVPQQIPEEIPQQAAGDPWRTWESYAGHVDSAQYSSLSQINRDNVSQLEVAWIFPTGEANHRSGPIIVGETMYVVANGGITALDAASGRQKWFAADSVAPNVRGLVYWRGGGEPGGGAGERLLTVRNHYLQAYDAQTGAPIESFGIDGRVDLRKGLGRDPDSITRIASMTPGRVFENLLVVGSAVGDEAYSPAPGDIRAYDILSGELVWSFHTIPHPGEAGYETWPAAAWQTVGAANAWSTLSVDEQRGIIYVPTGAPSYHFYGANRAGDNLYANSLIALDARTGQRLWHFQAVHHDVWDYDLAMAPMLLTVERDREQIDAVVLAGKHGFLFVFDRVTGEPVFPIEERPVPQSDIPGEQTSPTQPYPLTLAPFARQTLSATDLSPYADPDETEALAQRIRQARNDGLFTPPSLRGSVSVPGSRGGAQFGNGAVIPDAGLFYLAVIESPTIPVLEDRQKFTAEFLRTASPAEVYAASCALCHGAAGGGQPPLFPAIAGIEARMTGSEFQTLIQQGRGRMAAFPDLPPRQIAGLMDFVDQLDTSSIAEAVTAGAPARSGDETQRYRSGYHHFFTDTGLLGPLPWSKLMAFDLNEGRLLWEVPYGDVPELARQGITGTGSLFPTNSLTATAGGLLFSATNDRKLRAWDRETGEVLWTADLPADPGGIPAVYEIAGRQFVVATATRGVGSEHAYIAFALPESS